MRRPDNLRSHGRCKINFARLTYALAFALGLAMPASAEDLTLRMPAEMVEAGFHKQILPRFKFKHRITVVPVTEGEADMAFYRVYRHTAEDFEVGPENRKR